MEKWKREYDQIAVPENVKERMEEAVMRAKESKKRIRKVRMIRMAGSAAAVFAVLLILPNTSRTAAAAMQQIPVLGEFFKVVTIREYQVDEDRYQADVKVPEVVPEENKEISDETAQQAKETADAINFDIQQVTDELIEEFKSTMEEFEDGYGDILVDSQVLTDDEKWFSLDLVLYQGAGSGYERHRHYTIDKTTGKKAMLSDFFGEAYVDTISDEIKKQMRQRMAEDENVTYWIDNQDIPEWNFQSIAEDQDFYVNKDGDVVVCFNEYEVAPGYMGCVEFVIGQ
ncbi:MAG: RsiV family protein [Lachnospiraceae bacterium]|nr:RsiV family protein [Lachnospiraceae bacterium]